MLDTPVIVSDEKILNNDLCLYFGRFGANILCKAVDTETGRVHQELNINPIEEYGSTDGGINPLKSEILKIIAGIEGLPSIDWNGLEEEFGWVDYTLKEFEEERNKVYEETGSLTACTIVDRGISLGFKKALSLNEKKFSLEDMFKCFQAGIDYEKEGSILQPDAHGYIQSLQQPKVFDIEIDGDWNKEFYELDNKKNVPKLWKPRITNNSIKILRKL